MTEEDRLRIRAYLTELLRDQNDTSPFTDTTSLIATGRLNSMAVVQLVAFLETEFGVDFSYLEFDPQRFDSLESLSGMIEDWRRTGR